MNTLSRALSLKGELRSADDLTIEGRIDGSVFCESGSVVIAVGARVDGDIIARDITVFGESGGQLIATEIVDVRADAHVTGQVVSPRFVLDERAQFHGRVAPQMLDAAIRVAHFQQRARTVEPVRAGGAR